MRLVSKESVASRTVDDARVTLHQKIHIPIRWVVHVRIEAAVSQDTLRVEVLDGPSTLEEYDSQQNG